MPYLHFFRYIERERESWVTNLTVWLVSSSWSGLYSGLLLTAQYNMTNNADVINSFILLVEPVIFLSKYSTIHNESQILIAWRIFFRPAYKFCYNGILIYLSHLYRSRTVANIKFISE